MSVPGLRYPAPLRAALGAALRERRRELGRPLRVIAPSAGVSLGYLSQVEMGKNTPALGTLDALARAMGRTPAWFLDAAERAVSDAGDAVLDEVRKGGAN